MNGRLLVMWVVGLLMLACGSKTLSPAAAHIVDSDDLNLSDCSSLGRVKGSASESDSDAAEHAKNAAREKAAKLGATHIKWLIPCCSTVEGDAYRCDQPD